jgi:uncharacterized repeat protein (TIGR01451 family)
MKNLRTITVITLLFCSAMLLAGPRLEIEVNEQKLNMNEAERNGGPVIYSPGDTIEYTLTAKNTGDETMKDPSVVDPIPEGTEYVVNSAVGENCRIIFSVDKGMKFAVWPIMVTATSASGAKIEREARLEEVTHIKWLIRETIPAGGEKKLSFKVVVK